MIMQLIKLYVEETISKYCYSTIDYIISFRYFMFLKTKLRLRIFFPDFALKNLLN